MAKIEKTHPPELEVERYGERWRPVKIGKQWVRRPNWMIEHDILNTDKSRWRPGYMKWRDHFMEYVTALLGDPNGLYCFQWNPNAVRILDALLTNNRFVSICGCASSGKSRTLAAIAVAWWLIRPFNRKVLVTSTTVESAKGKIWGDVDEAWQAIAFETSSTVGGAYILPGRFIRSANRIRYEYMGSRSDKAGLELVPTEASRQKEAAEKIQGYKRGEVLLIGDEWDTLSPAVLKTAGANLTSNPSMKGVGAFNPTSRFSNGGIFSRPKEGWDTIDENTMRWLTEHGICIRLDAVAFVESCHGEVWRGLPTRRWIKEQEEKYGKDSPDWWSMVRGFFPPTGDVNTLYSEAELISQYHCHKTVEDSGGGWESKPEMVAGLDPSWMHGGDRAVLTIGKCGMAQFNSFGRRESRKTYEKLRTIVLDTEMDKKADKTEQVARLTKKYLEQYGVPCRNLAVDVTGSGGFVSLLTSQIGADFIQLSFAARPTDIRISKTDKRKANEVYKNIGSEIWCVAKELVRGGQIRGLDDDTMEEMCARRYKPGNGKGTLTEVSPKSQMKGFGHKSPDKADATLISIHAARCRCGLSSTEKPRAVQQPASISHGIFTQVYGALGVIKTTPKRAGFEVEKQMVAGGWGDD